MAKVFGRAKGTVASALTIANEDMINYPHIFATFNYYDADPDSGGVEVTPLAGTAVLTARYKGAGADVTFSQSPIEATDPSDYGDISGPVVSVTATPAVAITVATHWTMTVTGAVS